MTKAPTLLFCVGATKSGTSWLYKFLLRHPDCHLRSIKELHFFDNLDAGKTGQRAAHLRADFDRLTAEYQASPMRGGAARAADAADLAAALAEAAPSAYLGYLNSGIGARHLVADITPSYALLPADRLRAMAALLPDVRFLYLMRDPVARLWSHVRMSAFRSGGELKSQAAKILDAVLSGKQKDVSIRGDYQSAIARFDAAIAPSRLLLMFQEVLMTTAGIERLCSFLGIAQCDANFSNRVHIGPQLDMTNDQLLRARAALRPQYEFAASRFGTLPEPWLRNMGEGVA